MSNGMGTQREKRDPEHHTVWGDIQILFQTLATLQVTGF